METKIPKERKKQFELIELATKSLLNWAQENNRSLVHIYPVLPFVETDFSLEAWLFLDTKNRIDEYSIDGTLEFLKSRFILELEKVDYPKDWLKTVSFHFGSKEKVDQDYEGSFYYFLR